MKNLILGLALVAGVCACSSPSAKNSVSDGAPAAGANVECTGTCEGAKADCCSEKAAGAEAKTCPMTGKVQG